MPTAKFAAASPGDDWRIGSAYLRAMMKSARFMATARPSRGVSASPPPRRVHPSRFCSSASDGFAASSLEARRSSPIAMCVCPAESSDFARRRANEERRNCTRRTRSLTRESSAPLSSGP